MSWRRQESNLQSNSNKNNTFNFKSMMANFLPSVAKSVRLQMLPLFSRTTEAESLFSTKLFLVDVSGVEPDLYSFTDYCAVLRPSALH